MAVYEGEAVTLHEIDGPAFQAVRRNYELEIKTPGPGETVFTPLGEYATCQSDSDMWHLLPEERWAEVQYFQNENYPGQWATADDLRTWSGEGAFSPEHMDLIDNTLFRDQRKTSDANRLTVASEADLRALFADHAISTAHWRASVRRLCHDIRLGEPIEEKENISLHLVDGALWLFTAQTMVNVYHTGEDGEIYKLRETDITYFDSQGNPQPPKKSKQRSSLGETGHITGRRPERPLVAARRCGREEAGLEDDEITRIVSTGSLLRQKEAGHHSFGPIKAEDHTHYFRADLKPEAVRPGYINEEYDADGKLCARIKLEWFMQHPA